MIEHVQKKNGNSLNHRSEQFAFANEYDGKTLKGP